MPSPSTPRPLIAVTSRRLPADRISAWLEPAQALPTYYLDALHRAGTVGASMVSRPRPEHDADAVMARFDGLLVSGGFDVAAEVYGQEPHPTTTNTDAETDRWEIDLIHAARRTGIPVLAICRGAQLLNVAFGGTLHQHLPDLAGLGPHGIPNGGGGTPNAIEVVGGSRLDAAIGTEHVIGNCHHHQAIDRVGQGLTVTARTADGVIEAVECTDDPWTVGVQWHPEDRAMHDPLQQRLFDAFADVVSDALRSR
jgi:putative glutamine amidotransferase